MEAHKEGRQRWDLPFTAWNRARLYADSSILLSEGLEEALYVDDLEDAISEVNLYKELGGKTIVDVTPINASRQPLKLQQVSKKTGVNIIASTGFYWGTLLPKDMDQHSISDLAMIMVKEITEGINGTEVKAGIIGEVALDGFTLVPKESNEVRSLRASARASRLTGAAISLHGDYKRPERSHTILDILEEEGADLSRVIFGHVGAIIAKDIPFLETLLSRGVYLQFDLLGWPSAPLQPLYDQRPMLESIETLILYGYEKQILVSHDSFTKGHKAKYGGWGMTFVHTALLTYLRSKGVQERSIKNILENNPKRVLTFVKPQEPIDTESIEIEHSILNRGLEEKSRLR